MRVLTPGKVFYLTSCQHGSVAFKGGSVHGPTAVRSCQLEINSEEVAFRMQCVWIVLSVCKCASGIVPEFPPFWNQPRPSDVHRLFYKHCDPSFQWFLVVHVEGFTVCSSAVAIPPAWLLHILSRMPWLIYMDLYSLFDGKALPNPLHLFASMFPALNMPLPLSVLTSALDEFMVRLASAT
jgi:hypothetical protein